VTKDGRVKILDFGLAKLRLAPESVGSKTPTASVSTEAGLLVGTVGYMAPEQVQGRPADPRSDIFALGAVLYEMLGGRRAFQGATAPETLTAILKEEPPSLREVNPGVPWPLERVVKRCLEKRPAERFQAARDVAFALEDHSSASSPAMKPPPAARRRWLLGGAIGGALLAMATLGLLTGRMARDRPLPTIQQLTFREGTVESARFTSDGKTIVYGAFWDGNPAEVFSTRVESPESRSLSLPPARLLAVSSRGELAILLTRDLAINSTGTLARVPFSGGAPREVLDDVLRADWSPDGRELAVTRRVAGELQLEYPIGTILARPVGDGVPRVSPDGSKVAVQGFSEVVIYDRAGKKTRLGAPSVVTGLAWARDDAIWIAAGDSGDRRSVRLLTLDGRCREVYRAPGTLVLLDASRDGRVLVYHGFERMAVRAKPPGEAHERELGLFTWSSVQDSSLDGTHLLMDTMTATTGDSVTYLRSTRDDPPVRLGDGAPLALSPDARWALILAGEPKHPRLSLTPVGSGQPRQLSVERFAGVEGAWFMNDGHILVDAAEPGRLHRTFVFDASGGGPQAVTPEGVLAIPGSFAEGSIIGCCTAGRALARFPLTAGEPVSLSARLPDEVFPIRMTADGRSLFIGRMGVPLRVDRFELATGRVTPWKTMRPDDLKGVVAIWNVVITADGESYAYTYSRLLKDLFLIEGLH
jgi:hypothetical protein